MGESIEKNQKVTDLISVTMDQLEKFDHDTQNFFIKKLYNEMLQARDKQKKLLSEQADAIQKANNSLGSMFR